MRHEKLRFSNQLPYSLVLRESKRHILSICKIYEMKMTKFTMCLFLKKMVPPSEKIRFSTQLVSSLVLKGFKKAHFTIGKIDNVSKLTMCQNWQTVPLCSQIFASLKIQIFPHQLCPFLALFQFYLPFQYNIVGYSGEKADISVSIDQISSARFSTCQAL